MNFSQEEIDAELQRRESTPQQAGVFSQEEIAAELARRRVSPAPVAVEPPTPEPVEEQRSRIDMAKEGFGRVFSDPFNSVTEPRSMMALGAVQGARGVAQEIGKMTAGAAEGLGIISEGTGDGFKKGVVEQREGFEESKVGQTGFGKAGKVGGEVGALMAVPTSAGSVASSLLTKLSVGAAGGLAAGSLVATSDEDALSEERMFNTLLGGGYGIFGAALKPVIGGSRDLFSMFTKKGGKMTMVDDLSTLVKKADLKATDDAAKEVGVFLTPAERTNIPLIRSTESNITLPKETALGLQIKLLGREKTLGDNVKSLIQSIAPDDPLRAKALAEGYDLVVKTRMSPVLVRRIENNKVLAPEWKRFLKSKDYAPDLAAIPEDSMGRMDAFQKYLRERSQKLFNEGRGVGGSNIRDARKELVDAVDIAIPEYALARRISQLNIIKKNMMGDLAKIKSGGKAVVGEDGLRVPTSVQFYQKFLKSDDVFDNLMRNLDDQGDAALKATQLRVVLGSIEGTPIEKALDQSISFAAGGTLGQGTGGVIAQKAILQMRKNFYEGMVDYITDPNLASELLEASADLAPKLRTGAISKHRAQAVIDELVDVGLKTSLVSQGEE